MAPAAPSMNNHQPNPEAPPDRVYLLGRLKEGGASLFNYRVAAYNTTTQSKGNRDAPNCESWKNGRLEDWEPPRQHGRSPQSSAVWGGCAQGKCGAKTILLSPGWSVYGLGVIRRGYLASIRGSLRLRTLRILNWGRRLVSHLTLGDCCGSEPPNRQTAKPPNRQVRQG